MRMPPTPHTPPELWCTFSRRAHLTATGVGSGWQAVVSSFDLHLIQTFDTNVRGVMFSVLLEGFAANVVPRLR